jgi:type II secretory pathway component GspD/PulD (secretin)
METMKSMKSLKLILFGLGLSAFALPLGAQPEPVAGAPLAMVSFNFREAPLEKVLDQLGSLTGKSVTVDPDVRAVLTLSSSGVVTAAEAIDLITRALAEQGLRLVDVDARTLRIVRSANQPS